MNIIPSQASLDRKYTRSCVGKGLSFVSVGVRCWAFCESSCLALEQGVRAPDIRKRYLEFGRKLDVRLGILLPCGITTGKNGVQED